MNSEGSALPRPIWRAANQLYDYVTDPGLHASLEMIVMRRDELNTPDPSVELDHTLDTGSCLIHVCEVVPLSVYLYLRVKEADYTIQIAPQLQPIHIPFSNVTVKAWDGENADDANQSFNTKNMLKAYDEEEYEKVRTYVTCIGNINPSDLVRFNYLESMVEGVRNVLNGKRVRIDTEID